jgi:carboxylesterase type B
VTVFGQSAGAISAALLTIMPRACGLVHKVIQQSGGVVLRHTPEAADTVTHRLLAGAGLTPARRATMVFDESVQVVDAPLQAERTVWMSYVFTGGMDR